jgi:hypothetical protein
MQKHNAVRELRTQMDIDLGFIAGMTKDVKNRAKEIVDDAPLRMVTEYAEKVREVRRDLEQLMAYGYL